MRNHLGLRSLRTIGVAKMEIESRCSKEKFELASHMRQNPTPTEGMLWKALRAKQVRGVRFNRQRVVFGWIVDFWCPALLMVVEVDGTSHEGRAGEDARRDGVLAAKGIITLRVTNQQVHTALPDVIGKIKYAIDCRRFALSKLRPVATMDMSNSSVSVAHKPARRAITPKEARKLWELEVGVLK